MENRQWTEHIRRSIPWVVWEIWKNRNLLVFEGKLFDARSVIDKARSDAEVWFSLNQTPVTTAGHRQHRQAVGGSRWVKPCVGTLKCNISGSWRKKGENCGVAWLLRDHLGVVRLHGRRAFMPTTTAFEAELLSVFWAAESLSTTRQVRVEFETDCREVAEAIMQPQVWPLHRNLLSQIDNYLMAIEGWSVTVIEKEANRAARDIARSVTRDRRYQSYISSEEPRWLAAVLLNKERKPDVRGWP